MTTLRETLAEHPPQETSYDAGWIEGCWCGWERPPRISNEEGWAAYFAHLEAVVLAWVGARLAGARDGATLAIGRADGQPWASLDEAPSSGRFMGYPEMADAALAVVRDALGVPVAPNSAPVDTNPTSALAAEFDRSNDTDGICDPGCPLLGCPDCPIEASNRDHQEAK